MSDVEVQWETRGLLREVRLVNLRNRSGWRSLLRSLLLQER